MFDHVEIDLPTLSRETIDGVRFYSVPDGGDLLKLVSIPLSLVIKIVRFLLTGEKKLVMQRLIRLLSNLQAVEQICTRLQNII